jgi:cardiolipin synthase
MTAPRWKSGNRFRLLENGEEFFPAVFEAITSAKEEVILETFILYEDKVGFALHECLLQAARRGVRVDVTIDGYGSPDLSTAFVNSLTDAGVRLHVFDAKPKIFGRLRTNFFRRMHRKIVVVDAKLAFVGGINYSADHLADFGPEAKQDYAVAIEGPVVDDILRFVREAVAAAGRRRWWHRERGEDEPPNPPPNEGEGAALFVTRDNREHRNDIERHYRIALRAARREVIIANAYFFPGYRLLKDMRRAARRGVEVHLILQGQPDMPIVKIAARMLYDHLLRAGVRIHEYCDRPLHGKVALADGEWATVGSSNLDPLSLALNLEANVVIRDRGFNTTLRDRLQALMHHSCRQVDPHQAKARHWWQLAASYLAFHVLRRFPAWAGWLPAHEPTLAPASDFASEKGDVPVAPVWQWRKVDVVQDHEDRRQAEPVA